jgi:hypothetical protein
MKAVLILAFIAAVCTCSASNPETKGLEEEAEKGKVSCYAEGKTSISTSDQQSQTDEERKQYYDEKVKNFMKDDKGHELKEMGKRAKAGMERLRGKSLIQKLRQEESQFTSEDKVLCISFFCESLGLEEDASESGIRQVLLGANRSHLSLNHGYMDTEEFQGVQEALDIMNILGYRVFEWP